MFYSLTGGPKTGWSRTTRRRARRAKKFFYWLKLDMAAFDWPRENMKDFGGPFSFCKFDS